MSALVHTQDMVKKYNVDELSAFQKCTIDFEERNITIKLTKIFIALNGSSGCNVRNIPHNMAGFFSYYIDNKIYQKIKILKGRIDSYQRHVDSTQRMFDNILKDFNEIKSHWNHVIIQKRGTIPKDISFESAINHLQNLDTISSLNYSNYSGYSWFQWFEYLHDEFNSLVEKCEGKVKYYQQDNNMIWILSTFNPVSWYYFYIHFCTIYSKTVNEYQNFKNKSVIPKRNVIFNRLDDLNTANQALDDLGELIALEKKVISDPKNCQSTQQVLQNTLAFKSECNRIFLTIRDRIGFIGQE